MTIAIPQTNRKQMRTERGVSLVLVVVSAGFLIILVFIAFQFYTLNSGSREVRNAVDAAALNVSKQVAKLKVPISDQFADVADKGGLVGMSNINRVWGKAYLINANAEAIQKEGLANSYTTQNADQAYRIAQQSNDALVETVTCKQKLDTFFNDIANIRRAKLLGSNSELKTVDGPGWDVAMVDRGAPSNLKFDEKQIPKGAAVAPSNGGHVRGYTPFNANNKNFTFASFVPNEMPHLTTDSNFNSNDARSNPLNGNPVPNAFRANGINLGTKASLSASASSVANPMHEYRLAIPHAFIKINMENMAYWKVKDKMAGKPTPYGFEPKTVFGIKGYELKNNRILNGYASLGNEYKSGTLLGSMNALPGNHQEQYERMLQRIKEIKHDYTMGELMGMLQKVPPAPAYIIYPVYSSQDKTDPKIKIAPYDPQQPLPEAWMNSPIMFDGIDKLIVDEHEQRDEPNYCWPQIIGGNPDCEKYTQVSGKVMWAPGTGFGPCLGILKISRTTISNFITE
ncbi:MAG TPA: hypothetical protein EYM95_13300 [Candidatus Obscuribacterales bacterium]|jgi:hypothetical protein|nr:hypothetical protein [Candidatus Obscuribacterales bacterium]